MTPLHPARSGIAAPAAPPGPPRQPPRPQHLVVRVGVVLCILAWTCGTGGSAWTLESGGHLPVPEMELETSAATRAAIEAEMETLRRQLVDAQVQVERQRTATPATPHPRPSVEPEVLRTRNRKAFLRIGGEMYVDYTSAWRRGNQDVHAWSMRHQTLRFQMLFTPEVEARIRLNPAAAGEDQNAANGHLLEEAMVLWHSVYGGPLGLVFGKGEAPFGQDRAWGIMQSYRHRDAPYSPRGPVVLTGAWYGQDPYGAASNPAPNRHPGAVDAALLAGVNFTWLDRFRVEYAVFQPDRGDGMPEEGTNALSHAGRVWWNTPVEGLLVSASGMVQRDWNRSNQAVFGAGATHTQYAAAAGLEWDLPGMPLEVFAEYQRGWNWNYTRHYNTHVVSTGALYTVNDTLRLGAMQEWMRIGDRRTNYDYKKTVAHGRIDFGNGVSLTLEYGFEWLNDGRIHAHVFAMRSGVSF